MSNSGVTLRKKLRRFADRLCLTLFILFLLFSTLVQILQWVFRYRAERLLADFHAIRLHQSTWEDAQALMHRWGAWGHYDGSCTQISCRYSITLVDLAAGFIDHSAITHLPAFIFHPASIGLYEFAGGRFGALQIRFIVQDGRIWRTTAALDIHVPRGRIFSGYDYVDGDLVLYAQSRQSLNKLQPDSHWILGGNEQLAQHPMYKVGRPGGCTSCLLGEVTYAIQTSLDDIRRLTSYNFDCFTSRNCQILEDLLPAARDWYLYEPPWGTSYDSAKPSASPKPCDIPVWALGRDANAVIAVTTSGAFQQNEHGIQNEVADARYDEMLKGTVPYRIGSMVLIHAFSGSFDYPPLEQAEHIEPGKKYLLLVNTPMELPKNSPEKDGALQQLMLERCGVFEDSPENRAALTKGFAMNDRLRVAEF